MILYRKKKSYEAGLQVQLHLVLLQIHRYEFKYSQYFIFNQQKYTNYTQKQDQYILKGKTEVSILLQLLCRCSCTQSSLVQSAVLTVVCTVRPLPAMNSNKTCDKSILKGKTEVSIRLQLFCRCSCTQSCFKSTYTKCSTQYFIFNHQKYTNYTQIFFLLKSILKDKTEVTTLLQEGSCNACRLVECQACGSLVK